MKILCIILVITVIITACGKTGKLVPDNKCNIFPKEYPSRKSCGCE